MTNNAEKGEKVDFDKNVAHIVYAADEKFAEILGVSLVSLYENSRDLSEICVYVLESGISPQNKRRLLSVCRKYRRKAICFIKTDNISRILNMNVETDRGSQSQYARLFISRNLPCNPGRVLYLDCDIIVSRSVSTLWRLDMHGKTIAALMDALSTRYRANIGLKPGDVMFNSGVMLIDTELWRKNNIEEKLTRFIVSKKGKIQYGDQGALNAVLSSETYCFEPVFNSISLFYDFNYREMMVYRKPPDFYSESQIKEATENPVIIHFTTSFLSVRPWHEGCRHRYAGKWMHYKNNSPWAENPLWKNKKRPLLRKLYLSVIKRLPRNISVWLSGLLHAYIRTINLRQYRKING